MRKRRDEGDLRPQQTRNQKGDHLLLPPETVQLECEVYKSERVSSVVSRCRLQ